MSAKKKPTILGPDGKPYVAPKPKAKAETVPAEKAAGKRVTFAVVDEVYTIDMSRWMTDFTFSGSVQLGPLSAAKPKRPALADAVARDIAALTASFEGHGTAELPSRPRDLTAYDDAFASARKACPHANVTETTYAAREGYCEDCRRYVRFKGGMFGGGWS